jgi:hypothetical protein
VSPNSAVVSRQNKTQISMRAGFLLFLFAMHLLPDVSIAQVQSADSTFLYESLENAIGTSPNHQKALFSGTSYTEVRFDPKKGHPYFQSYTPLTGDVLYHDIMYRNEDFRYDIVRDEIVLEHLNGQKIILVKEKLSSFVTGGHTFRYFPSDGQKITPGYYEVLYDGKDTQLLARREKKMKGNPQVDFPYFVETTKYFLRRNGVYHKVKNSKEITRTLADGRKLNTALLRKDPEARMVDVIMQFETAKK